MTTSPSPRIVVVPVDHPQVPGSEDSPRVAADPPPTPSDRRAMAERHRAAARVAARHGASLLVPGDPEDFSVLSSPTGEPSLVRHRDGQVELCGLGVSLAHAGGWGAAFVWLLPPGDGR